MAESGMRAATPPAGEKETKDKELQALKDAHAAIGRRLDALFGKGRSDDDDDDDDRKDARADEDEEDKEKEEEEARDDSGRADAGDRGKSMKDSGRADQEENFGGKKAPPFKGDRKDADPPSEEWVKEEKEEPEHAAPSEEEKPAPLAADRKDEESEQDSRADDDDDRRDSRRDTRADSALRRRIEALERGPTDEEIERLAEEQQLWSEPAMAHGERVSRPMHGESLLGYMRRNARHFQHYSDKWGKVDLRQLPPSALRIAAPEIRKDAVSAAYRSAPGGEPVLREIIRQDRTGRRISEFAGPVAAMLDQFRMPSFRVRRINTQPAPY